MGKETIDLYNTSDTRGSQRSYGMNYQKIGKELMSQDEIAVMDGGKCILQVRGVRPFFSNKYEICKHKNYKYLSDYDNKNIFDIEKYLSTNLIVGGIVAASSGTLSERVGINGFLAQQLRHIFMG